MNNATIYINGVIGDDTNLIDVIRQFKALNNPQSITVMIDSVGGCVDTGKSIYNYLKGLNIPVTTVAERAYSIASYIFFAGDNRMVVQGDDRLMIHFAWASVDGHASQLEMVAKELRAIEKEFVEFYSNNTSIDAITIQQLLHNETFLTAQEAVELGFATAIKNELSAVAYLPNNQINKKEKMNKKKNFLKAFFEFFESEINALELQDANGETIDFVDLDADAEPQPRTDEVAGDKAEKDGKPVEGDVVMPDGSTFKFEAGELIEIIPAEVEEEETEEEVETEEEMVAEEFDFEAILKSITESVTAELKAENDELKAEIKAIKKLITTEDVTVQARNTSTKINKKTSNYLRG